MTDEPTDRDRAPTEDDIKRFDELKKHVEKHFYFLIGGSLTAWSSMEGFLVHVATMLLDTTPEKAGLVLYSTNFLNWLKIIHDLFDIDPSYQPLLPDWNKIENRLKGLNDVRVQLAHHSVVESGMVAADVVSGKPTDLFPSLRPNKFDMRPKTLKQGALEVPELVKFMKDLGAVTDPLTALIDRMLPIYREQKKAFIDEVARLQREARKEGP